MKIYLVNRSAAAFILFMLLLASCKKETNRGQVLSLNKEVKITGFTSNGASGVVNDTTGTITIELPFGSNFMAVSPSVTASPGAVVSPGSGASVNLKNAVKYRVSSGNIYSDYTVTATEKKALLSFTVAGVTATIDETARTVYAIVPNSTNLASLVPTIVLASGATISPASGAVANFTNPVTYTVTSGSASVTYTVTVVTQASVAKVAFLGTAANRTAITNPDELAAINWLSSNFANVTYISFDGIKSGTVDPNQYKVIWWHEDATQALPSIAFDADVVNKLKLYRTGGGAFLLSSYGAQYLEALGIVPAGKNPNNIFGDNTASLELNNDWGISFKTTSTHPVFQGLTLTTDKPYPTAYLLAKNTFRLNHSALWKVNEWGGYGTIANWRSQTGGIDLASTEWDEDHINHVTIAEFPRTASNGRVIAIVVGAYDWYNEPNPANGNPSAANGFKPNTERLTKNAIQYLIN